MRPNVIEMLIHKIKILIKKNNRSTYNLLYLTILKITLKSKNFQNIQNKMFNFSPRSNKLVIYNFKLTLLFLKHFTTKKYVNATKYQL